MKQMNYYFQLKKTEILIKETLKKSQGTLESRLKTPTEKTFLILHYTGMTIGC